MKPVRIGQGDYETQWPDSSSRRDTAQVVCMYVGLLVIAGLVILGTLTAMGGAA